jgi:hypothetical protein
MSQHTLDAMLVTAIVVGVTSAVLAVMFVFGSMFNRDWGTPHYRRELEATYASFRRFLMTVQAVVVKRLQE